MGRIALGALLILAALLGLRQFSEMRKTGGESGNSGAAVASMELISFISHGEEIDIPSTLPAEGYAIVEFTADW